MNREIKFRGLNKAHNQWIYGYFFKYPNGRAVIYESDSSCLEVSSSSVGQYTGLKDKHGTKIFEGDIVKHRGYNGMQTSVVKFEAGAFIVGYHDGSSTKRRPMLLQDKVEVIGNIHERKEMQNELD